MGSEMCIRDSNKLNLSNVHDEYTWGISIEAYTGYALIEDVSITNNVVSGANQCIAVWAYNTIENVYIHNNTISNGHYGIRLYDYADNVVITKNQIFGSYYGVHVVSGITFIQSNNISYNTYGIYADISSNNQRNVTIINNTISYNIDDGILIYYYNASITNNTITHNNGFGIEIISADYTSIINNTISSNDGSGIVMDSCMFLRIIGNYISENYDGVYLLGCRGVDLKDNVISDNPDNGAYFFDCDDVFVANNTVSSNNCLLYTSPSPRDLSTSRMPSSA